MGLETWVSWCGRVNHLHCIYTLWAMRNTRSAVFQANTRTLHSRLSTLDSTLRPSLQYMDVCTPMRMLAWEYNQSLFLYREQCPLPPWKVILDHIWSGFVNMKLLTCEAEVAVIDQVMVMCNLVHNSTQTLHTAHNQLGMKQGVLVGKYCVTIYL